MNKILSWKINNTSYGYIFPTNGSYISNAISEDSPLWVNIIGEISTWSLDTYKNNFNKMAAEVKNKFGVTIPWKDEYWDLGVGGSVGGVNIVMLSGKGGDGGYSDGVEIGPEVYEEFNKMIDAELQKAREAIEKKNAEVKAFVEAKVTETISAAKQTIAETKAEIDETRDELEGKLEGATEALDKAAALFELGEGGIDGEAIKDVMNSVSAHTTWLNTYSGTVADFQTDYDIATQRLGEMTVASSVTDGLFSQFATSMNVMSGTVGSVERTMNAAYGEIRDAAEWIDTNKDSVANVSRFISASAALIEDKIKYIDNELTSVIERTVDGKNATIRDEIKAETASGLTNVRNEMNALSGSILQELTHYAPDSAITSMGERMDAMDTTMSTWMTKTDSAMSMTHDLREEWSIESGKISTVTNLLASTDPNGDIQYWVSGDTGEEIRVYKIDDGVWNDDGGNVYPDSRVYVHYSETLGSYINQEVSSITLSVMGTDNMTAAIRLAVEEDAEKGGEAIISLVADKVVIDADIIAKAISAKTANIGGIMIGNGIVESMARFYTGEVYHAVSAYTISEDEPPLILRVIQSVNDGDPVYYLRTDNILEDKFVTQVSEEWWLYIRPIFYENDFINFGFPCISNEDGKYVPRFEGISVPPLNVYSVQEIIEVDGVNETQEVFYFSSSTVDIINIEVHQNEYNEWIDDDGNMYSDTSVFEIPQTSPAFKLNGRDGTISAFNAEIVGAITATSLTLGNGQGIDDYVSGKIPTGLTNESKVNELISAFVETEEFKNSITDGYVSEDYLEEWYKTQSGLTEEQVQEMIESAAGAEVNIPLEKKDLGDGGVRHTIKIGDKEYSWDTYDVGDYVLLGKEKSGTTNGKTTSTLISKNGLLEANNAIIYGEIHANAGSIGGMVLRNNMLEVTDSENSNNAVAFLNGSNEYESDINGKLIIASGIKNDNYYYKYVCNDTNAPYNYVYTKKDYSIAHGNKENETLEVFTYDEDTNEYTLAQDVVYFHSINSPTNNTQKKYSKRIVYRNDEGSDIVETVCEYLTLEHNETFDNFTKQNNVWTILSGVSTSDGYIQMSIMLNIPTSPSGDFKQETLYTGYINTHDYVGGYLDGIGNPKATYFYKFYRTISLGTYVGRETEYYIFGDITGRVFDSYVYRVKNSKETVVNYNYYPCVGEIIIKNTSTNKEIECQINPIPFNFNGGLYYEVLLPDDEALSGRMLAIEMSGSECTLYDIVMDYSHTIEKTEEDSDGIIYIYNKAGLAVPQYTAVKSDYFYYSGLNGMICYRAVKKGDDNPSNIYYYNDTMKQMIYFILRDKTESMLVSFKPSEYEHKVTNKSENANTKIFSDGTIITTNLQAQDGYFGGNIDSGGIFKGVLNCSEGYFKNADINVKNISGKVILNKDDIFAYKNDTQTLFEIKDVSLAATQTTQYVDVSSYSTSVQNSNGNNDGQYYGGQEIILAEIFIPAGSVITGITIPNIEVVLNRYAPHRRTNNSCSVEVYAKYVGYSNNIVTQKCTASTHKGSGWSNVKKTLSFGFTFSTSTVNRTLQIILKYRIHLSTYSLLGCDKAYFNLQVTPKGRIVINYTKVPNKTAVGNNGAKLMSPNGAVISVIDGTINILSSNNKFGLNITDSGIFKISGGTRSSL